MNDWKKIWQRRKETLNEINLNDSAAVSRELMRLDGFDIKTEKGGVELENLVAQYNRIKSALFPQKIENPAVFEVGCGAGFYLYLFAKDGFKVGGLDYSENQLSLLQKFIPVDYLTECICAGADELPTDLKYDAIFSWGVFYYFENLNYAETVLQKMLSKSKGAMYILDVYDKNLEKECMAERRKNIPDYDERYKNLPKLFYPRSFFEDFAAKNNLSVRFDENKLENYGNAPFTFHCLLEKI